MTSLISEMPSKVDAYSSSWYADTPFACYPKQTQSLLRCMLSEARILRRTFDSPLHDSQISFRQSVQAHEQMQFS
jgi:hypothetical protein